MSEHPPEEEVKPGYHEERNDPPWPIFHTTCRYKSSAPASQQDLPHSGLKYSFGVHPSSPDEGLRPEPYGVADYNRHAVRESNLSSLKREKKPKINFPPPNDSSWKAMDAELKSAIPIAFDKAKMRRKTVSQHSTNGSTSSSSKNLATALAMPNQRTRRKGPEYTGDSNA